MKPHRGQDPIKVHDKLPANPPLAGGGEEGGKDAFPRENDKNRQFSSGRTREGRGGGRVERKGKHPSFFSASSGGPDRPALLPASP